MGFYVGLGVFERDTKGDFFGFLSIFFCFFLAEKESLSLSNPITRVYHKAPKHQSTKTPKHQNHEIRTPRRILLLLYVRALHTKVQCTQHAHLNQAQQRNSTCLQTVRLKVQNPVPFATTCDQQTHPICHPMQSLRLHRNLQNTNQSIYSLRKKTHRP